MMGNDEGVLKAVLWWSHLGFQEDRNERGGRSDGQDMRERRRSDNCSTLSRRATLQVPPFV